MARPVAVITGASRGIGRQLAVDLARDGWDVVCVARTTAAHPSKLPGTVDATAQAVADAGGRAMSVGLDVQDEDACAALADRVYGEWGRCDLLINNAAVAPPKPALDDSIRRWRMAVDVNLNGPFYLTWHFGRRMIASGKPGRVINVSSAAAVMPEFGRPSYTATKLGLEGLTQALGHELEGKIAVNCIRIDFPIWTEGFDATLPDDFDTTGFEDPVVMTDAVLWVAKRDLAYTAKVVTLLELRQQKIVRPETPVVR